MLDLTQAPYFLSQKQVKQVKNMVENMPLEAKIGQLFFIIGPDEANIEEFISRYQPGGIMYRPDNALKIIAEINSAQNYSKVPLFIAANLESGGNGLLKEGTWVGNPLQIAATDDPSYAFELGKIGGAEAKQVGGNMAFAPIVDLDLNFRNPIMNTRTFGSSLQRVLYMSEAETKGFKSQGIIPVIKHFPGDGVDERDQHLLSSINSLSTTDWNQSYGKIYQQFINQGIPAIMIAHIMQPAWEKKLNPNIKDQELRPASTSSLLINGLLRQKLKFQGLAITDATPMLGYNTAAKRQDLLPMTINAGIDMILFNKNIDEDYQYIRTAIKRGIITIERVNEAVSRILGTKMAQGLLSENKAITSNSKVNLDFTNHQAIAKVIAKKSVTLVKDRDHLLPLTPEKYPRLRLVILGDHNDGGFKEGGLVSNLFIQKLKDQRFQVQLFDRKHLDMHEVFSEGVQDLRAKFDLALYVANVETASNQTTRRLDWVHLMAADAPWFLRDIPTVFVSMANPYHLFDVPDISTFVNAYTGNPASITAVIDKLMGREPFNGISPIDPFCGDFRAKL